MRTAWTRAISIGEGGAEAEAKNFGAAPRRDEDDVVPAVRLVCDTRRKVIAPTAARPDRSRASDRPRLLDISARAALDIKS
jgi:hypothetical protein